MRRRPSLLSLRNLPPEERLRRPAPNLAWSGLHPVRYAGKPLVIPRSTAFHTAPTPPKGRSNSAAAAHACVCDYSVAPSLPHVSKQRCPRRRCTHGPTQRNPIHPGAV